MKTYIPEPDRQYEWNWTDRPHEQQRAVTNNRRRTQREYGKQLQRRRSEVVERSGGAKFRARVRDGRRPAELASRDR